MNEILSFDPIWEKKYSKGHAERYPWDFVVSFIYRNRPQNVTKSDIKILEVGCGTSSNLWFAAREGFSVAGIDASESAINFALKRFQEEGLSGDLRVGNFTSIPFESDYFDLVIDRCSITCCSFSSAIETISEISRVMKKGGKFLFNPYSDRHSSYSSGNKGNDGLILNIDFGTLVNVGQICFYGRKQIEDLLKNFKIVSIQHYELVDVTLPAHNIHAEWRIIAKK